MKLVQRNPSGSCSKAIQVLQENAEDYASKLTVSTLNREEALTSYLQYFIPKIGFTLPTLALMEEQCYKIQSPALNICLQKVHLNQHTARSIFYDPKEYGGLNIPHAYFIQSIGQSNLFIGHLQAQDKTGHLILLSMSYLQILTGSRTSFLHLPYSKYSKWIESSWLTSIWCCVSRVKFTLIVKNAWMPLQRTNDLILMDYFVHLNYKPKELKSLNRCRIYLQVIFLSDIASVDSTEIAPKTLCGEMLSDRKSRLPWPTQHHPPKEDWLLWSLALKHLQSHNKLKTKLTT
jgi:hypothetical protein